MYVWGCIARSNEESLSIRIQDTRVRESLRFPGHVFSISAKQLGIARLIRDFIFNLIVKCYARLLNHARVLWKNHLRISYAQKRDLRLNAFLPLLASCYDRCFEPQDSRVKYSCTSHLFRTVSMTETCICGSHEAHARSHRTASMAGTTGVSPRRHPSLVRASLYCPCARTKPLPTLLRMIDRR